MAAEKSGRLLSLDVMIVVVDTRSVWNGWLGEKGYFSREVLLLLTAQHPEHHFHLIFSQPHQEHLVLPANTTRHIISLPLRHPLLWKYWFDVKLPLLLKKIKADVFFSDGQCSLTARVPQCMVVRRTDHLPQPEMYRNSYQAYLKKHTPAFIRKAKAIITPTLFLKQQLIQHYQANSEKITVVHGGAKEIFRPVGFDEQSRIKEKYTGGTEFFISIGPVHPHQNLVNLLKAFSVFKKRLQSSMKLVLAGETERKQNAFSELLHTYKYKEEVVLAEYADEEEGAWLLASAYACVDPSFEGSGVLLPAMRCHVPVLATNHPATQEISGGAALYFDANNIDDMADKLMLVYKDERRRSELIEKGKLVAAKYTGQQTADALWNCLVRTVSHS